MRVAMNSFALRHWTQSGLTKTTLSADELVELVQASFANQEAGYRDGVILVNVPADSFSTPLRKIEAGDELVVKFEARREGEVAFMAVGHQGPSTQADKAQVVLYRHDVLGSDATTDAEWEVVSLNASVVAHGDVPMNPMTMARNFLQMEGGTAANYSAEDFAKSIVFWATHAMGV